MAFHWVCIVSKCEDIDVYAGMEAIELPSPKELSESIIRNFRSVFGTEYYRTDVTNLTYEHGGVSFRLNRIFEFNPQVSETTLPQKFNIYQVCEFEFEQDTEDAESILSEFFMIADAGQRTHYLYQNDQNIFNADRITRILHSPSTTNAAFEAVQGKKGVEPLISAMLISFFIYAGYSLKVVEDKQTAIELTTDLKRNVSKFSAPILECKVFLMNIRKIFLTRSQSHLAHMRDVAESVIVRFRLRDRIKWHIEVNDELEEIIDQTIKKHQQETSKRTARTLFVLTSFTVLSSLFFGLFTVNSEADIVVRGMDILQDARLFAPLVVSSVMMLFVTLFVYIWPSKK